MRTIWLTVQSERIYSFKHEHIELFSKIDNKMPSDNDEGLKELLWPNVLKEANAELRRVADSPEPGCSKEVLLNKSSFPQCFENNRSLLHTF